MYIYSNICKNDKTGVSSYGDLMVILWFRSYFELKFFRCASCNALEIAVEGGVTPLVAVRMMRLMP